MGWSSNGQESGFSLREWEFDSPPPCHILDTMKVIIAGSRSIPPHIGDELVRMATRIAALRGWEITEVVCGEARGIDLCGRRWAERHCIAVKSLPADWSRGRAAGFLRNGEMAGYGDALIAITNGSPGTRDMIQKAKARKMPMVIIAISGGIEWIAGTSENRF